MEVEAFSWKCGVLYFYLASKTLNSKLKYSDVCDIHGEFLFWVHSAVTSWDEHCGSHSQSRNAQNYILAQIWQTLSAPRRPSFKYLFKSIGDILGSGLSQLLMFTWQAQIVGT